MDEFDWCFILLAEIMAVLAETFYAITMPGRLAGQFY
jgi:hypothetical protein